ncbi:site-2 protease family protein [Mesorhizobium neociceri]|uniref:Site-2 protease family protein n=1 Tax=Mesorhizobium neociceri TaxID=1307853 RepID=A0A838BE60_9HYPH|nr:site-2 protease family protein [Mesorhizobium neociceri]MBA1144582.1 site-2 protease family protein [Mesorhizobium neociceri]
MPFLALASLFISAWIGVALHEASHAAAARLANLQIREVRVGKGPTVFRTRLLETDFYLGLIPLGGWVRTFPSLRYSKSAMLLFYAAGPAMDLTWFAVLITTLVNYRDSELGGAILAPAIIVQGMMLFGNLVPHHAKLYGERLPNDMLALLKTAFAKGDPNAAYRESYLNAVRRYADPMEPPFQLSGRSDRIAAHLFERDASSPHLTDERIAALEHELALTTSRSGQLLIIDNIATNIVAHRTPRHDAYLDWLTARAVALFPELPTLKGTRGAALARLGRYEEALAILDEADHSEDFNRCLNAAFRALAHFHLGRGKLATAEFDTAAAILRSQDWASWIGSEIVNAIGAEIGYSTQVIERGSPAADPLK